MQRASTARAGGGSGAVLLMFVLVSVFLPGASASASGGDVVTHGGRKMGRGGEARCLNKVA
jgi:hypothetical protein